MQNTEKLAIVQHTNGSGLVMPEVTNGKVDARSVHKALGVPTPFHMWFARRIAEFGFTEGVDYETVCCTNLCGKPGSGGANRTDYLVTLDMAKELAMVERTEVGKRMRRYFIECEKRLSGAPGGLGKLEAALVELAREHDSRIATLETHMRPGDDWISVRQWAEIRGLQLSHARMSVISRKATHRSAMLKLPTGQDRIRITGHSRRAITFAPKVLDEIGCRMVARWAEKDAAASVPSIASVPFQAERGVA